MADPSIFEIFPTNGLDRSLHAPVFVGLLLLAFFAEMLGWTFAGLVVPGYYASVIIAAPATAVLVAVETLVTYALSSLLGRWLPRTQVWSTAFGRERFFLFILVALAVRLSVEASILPWLTQQYHLPHSRELHSLGLVLVPLLANMFWNAGFWASIVRVSVVVGLTYAFVQGVLLEHTNFTVSRFEIANESVSLAFLEAPHAQLILLIGALIAARANVLYGWDYNGILVPALLSVAWYQPTKLITTVVEALLVYGVARGLSTLPPLNRVLIVGTRRSVLIFAVGFMLKWIGGLIVMRVAPTVHIIDYLGFGYLLPTLLATKMWNRNAIGTVIVPTLQVSIVAFCVGNAVGYGMTLIQDTPDARLVAAEPINSSRPAAVELMLGDTADAVDDSAGAVAPRLQVTREVVRRVAAGETFDTGLLDDATQLQMRLQTAWGEAGRYLVIRPQSADPDRDAATPRIALRLDSAAAAPWIVVAGTEAPQSPVVVLADQVARVLDARAIAVEALRRPTQALDRALVPELSRELSAHSLLRVVLGPRLRLRVVGELPPGLDVEALSRLLDAEVDVSWESRRPLRRPFDTAPQLEIPAALARQVVARLLPGPEPQVWQEGLAEGLSRDLEGLTSVRPYAFAGPSIEELRLFRAGVMPAAQALQTEAEPSPWTRSLAWMLGYRFVRASRGGRTQAWGVIEPPGEDRRGHASWFVRANGDRTRPTDAPDAGAVMVEAPATRWEAGAFRAALLTFEGLDANALLLAGAPPNAAPEGKADVRHSSGRRSFYHAVHQGWVDDSGKAVAIHGISRERDPGLDVVLSIGRELNGIDELPAWTRGVTGFFDAGGLRVATVDGSLPLSPFEGSFDPALGYARRFAPDSTLLLWLGSELRGQFVRMQEDRRTLRRLELLQVPDVRLDVAQHAFDTARCLTGTSPTDVTTEDCSVAATHPECPTEQVVDALERYTRSRNPHDLRAALRSRDSCQIRFYTDDRTNLHWALTAGARHVWLVPVLGGPVRRFDSPARALVDLRERVAMGLGSTAVEPAP